jgi:hypothetical protein
LQQPAADTDERFYGFSDNDHVTSSCGCLSSKVNAFSLLLVLDTKDESLGHWAKECRSNDRVLLAAPREIRVDFEE